MIDSKYALKYKMPHSVVHIVDNSSYTGPLQVVTAEDPSLLASIVVTGAPMGADNQMITINRSDVLGQAYSMANLSADDIERYGQGVTYAGSLINQGAPVRFMRVTPEDATYAVSSLVVQWRIDDTDNKLHVRFKTKEWPEELQRNRFKNTARVNEALVKYFKTDNVETDSQGSWNQRAFINFISAGRGSVYNFMANAINMTSQAKRPANVRYEFDTIDTRTNQVVERFFASLVNINNQDRTDAVDPVNVAVSKRVAGSSIVVPYVNTAAVRELYNVYMSYYKNMLDVTEPDDFVSNAYKTMNINIFDMIFGNYIYNGTDTTTKMPFYQVDMIDTDVPKLEEDRRLCVLDTATLFDKDNPTVLYDKVLESTYGVTRAGDTVHVGDLYLSTPGNSNANPKLSIITSINQYTGNVTSMTIPRVFPLSKTSTYTELDETKSVYIATIVSDIKNPYTDDASSVTINKLVSQGVVTDSSVIAANRYDAVTGNPISGFDLYTVEVEVVTDPITGIASKIITLHYMDPKFYYKMLDRSSHSGGIVGTGNAMGFEWTSTDLSEGGTPDAAWNRPGATVVVQETTAGITPVTVNKIYVNNYNRTEADDSDPDITKNRIYVADAATHGIVGNPPTSVNLTDDLIGAQFDILAYNNNAINTWKTTGVAIDPSTTTKVINVGEANETTLRYNVGDRFYVACYANANDVTPYTESDIEKYTLKTADDAFINDWQRTNKTSAFITEAPGTWSDDYVNYSKYDSTTKRIVSVATMTLVGEEPAEFDPTAYYKKNDSNVYVKGVVSEVWAANTWYSADPTSAPSFDTIQVFKTTFIDAWNVNKSRYTDTIDTTNCKTIVTVTGVNDETGEITDVSISNVIPYGNTETSIQTLLTTATALKGVFIPDYSKNETIDDPRIAQLQPTFTINNFKVVEEYYSPSEIDRYTITGALGSLFKIQNDPTIIPANYYSSTYGINPSSENGGIRLSGGYTGFFDDPDISEIEFKWRYSALLVRAFRGDIDPRIQSPNRCPAKFLFDAGYNTIVGSTILPYLSYTPADIINASIIFTEDEKDEILYHPEILDGLKYEDIDVKQAMYDLMIYRIYQGMPEDMRPEGYGSGLSLHLDSGVTDANTAMLVNTSFAKRFDNPNASWDIGGWVDIDTGVSFTYTKQIVDNLIRHIRSTSINKPYVGADSAISPDKYSSYFPDVDTTDWELRELLYNAGGNAWIMGSDGSLTRRSQKTLLRDSDTSDILQENNMRTLSQLTYLLQNEIDNFLLEYNDDAVIKTLSDQINNKFSNWIGNLVDALEIRFVRDINPTDGGEILVCYCDVTFRGLILRVPIIVNINRRNNT